MHDAKRCLCIKNKLNVTVCIHASEPSSAIIKRRFPVVAYVRTHLLELKHFQYWREPKKKIVPVPWSITANFVFVTLLKSSSQRSRNTRVELMQTAPSCSTEVGILLQLLLYEVIIHFGVRAGEQLHLRRKKLRIDVEDVRIFIQYCSYSFFVAA